jgi:hypothetical protein
MFMPAAFTVQVVDSSADWACPTSGGAVLSGGASLFGPGTDPHALSTRPRPNFSEKRLLILKVSSTQENSPREPDAAAPGESF